MAAAVGIGPTSRHLECPVLPLNDTAVYKFSYSSVRNAKRLSALSRKEIIMYEW